MSPAENVPPSPAGKRRQERDAAELPYQDHEAGVLVREQPKPEIADRSRRQRAELDGHPGRHWCAPAEHDDHGQCGHGTDNGDGGKADPDEKDLPSLGTELGPALHTAEAQAPQPHREREEGQKGEPSAATGNDQTEAAMAAVTAVATAAACSTRKRASESFSTRSSRGDIRSEEHTSELQSLMRISYAVFCLNNKTSYTPT